MVLGPISGRIAVVGTGVIGASWAAYFLAKGFDVAATDPADGAEKRLRTLIDGFWPTLERIGQRHETRRGYRNGTKTRTLTGPSGPLALRVPRATLFGTRE